MPPSRTADRVKIRVGFGLGTTSCAGMHGEAFWSVIDALESQRWDSVWISERVSGDIPDALAALAAVAGRTRRLKFGMSVLVLPGRNPVLLAKELATIDVLSNGRLVPAFGLGADIGADRRIFGVEGRERAGRTDEATVLIKTLWTQDAVTFSGRYFDVRDLTLRPRPVQQPHPDVWFGGHSQAALRRVGRIGDGWLPSFVSAAEYAPKADEIRRVAADHGREVEEEHYGALVAYCSPEGAEAIMPLVRARRPEVDPADVIVAGDDAALRTRLEAFAEAGASKFVIVPVLPPKDWVDELARLRETVVRPLEN